ncbi:uncharacterized protein LOC135830701 [Sycon ciliatum]|uniref:uncharacterized protein LOC135830701 n=1 Tax=Sycon ciliatum TaxID=27933 RepID=UPI0031F615E9
MDVMRIPSTKRVCLVGQTRSYPLEDEQHIEQQRHQLISHCQQQPSNGGSAAACVSESNAAAGSHGRDHAMTCDGCIADKALAPSPGLCTNEGEQSDANASVPSANGSNGHCISSSQCTQVNSIGCCTEISNPLTIPDTNNRTHQEPEATSGLPQPSNAAAPAESSSSLASSSSSPLPSSPWLKDFTARSATEAVRNGTKLSRHLVDHIVNTVVMAILDRGDKAATWNSGGKIATLFHIAVHLSVRLSLSLSLSVLVHQPRTQKSSNSSTLLHLEIEYLILASMGSLGTLYTESANKKSKRLARSAGGSRQSDHFWHFIDSHCCDLNPISNQCHARFRNELSDFCELREKPCKSRRFAV